MGGVRDRGELASAVAGDAVVAAHYEPIDVPNVRAVVLERPRKAYVSYRVGDKIFWTKKPVQLAAGEALLTDGRHEVRARCGNRVSDIAQEPVSAVEPASGELDEVEPAHVPLFALARSQASEPFMDDPIPNGLTPPPDEPPFYTTGTGSTGTGFTTTGTTTGSTTTGSTGDTTTGSTTGESTTGTTTGFTTTGSTGDTTTGSTTGESTTGTTTGSTGETTTGTTTGETTTGTTTGFTTTVWTTTEDTSGDTTGGTTGTVPEPQVVGLITVGIASTLLRRFAARR